MVCLEAEVQTFEGFDIKFSFPIPQAPQVVFDPQRPPVTIRDNIKSGALSSPSPGDQAGYERLFGGNLPTFASAVPAAKE